MRLILLFCLAATVSGCDPSRTNTPAPEQTGNRFCLLITPAMIERLRIDQSDSPDERLGKLQLFGRYECECNKNCPEGR